MIIGGDGHEESNHTGQSIVVGPEQPDEGIVSQQIPTHTDEGSRLLRTPIPTHRPSNHTHCWAPSSVLAFLAGGGVENSSALPQPFASLVMLGRGVRSLVSQGTTLRSGFARTSWKRSVQTLCAMMSDGEERKMKGRHDLGQSRRRSSHCPSQRSCWERTMLSVVQFT